MNNFNPNNIDREKILERKYFHQLPRKTQRELMAYWRENYPTGTIRERMGLSGTAFYNLLKRLKLPTNVQRVRIEDDFLEDDLPVIQDENPINTINLAMGKNLENESNIEVRVSIFGEVNVSIHDLPNLVLEAHEKGFELEIKEIVEEINQPLFRG
jgi:hypothetical protein